MQILLLEGGSPSRPVLNSGEVGGCWCRCDGTADLHVAGVPGQSTTRREDLQLATGPEGPNHRHCRLTQEAWRNFVGSSVSVNADTSRDTGLP